MNILIEGWRGINHSYALVNQWQIKELIKSTNIFFKDMPYLLEKWNPTENDSGFERNFKDKIRNLSIPDKNQDIDIFGQCTDRGLKKVRLFPLFIILLRS